MLNTKLILIEGLPGAGKSTTTQYLGTALRSCGIPCDFFKEEDEPHPIPCLDFPIQGLPRNMIPLWRDFTEKAMRESMVTVIESRLWQNTALFMHMSNVSAEKIIDFNCQLGETLAPLSPVLIVLDQPDVSAALQQMAAMRGEAWVQSTLRETLDYPWFTSRGIHDFDGWVSFFEEWQDIAGRLYDDWPHRKTKILNPHEDWAEARKKMLIFLQFDNIPLSVA